MNKILFKSKHLYPQCYIVLIKVFSFCFSSSTLKRRQLWWTMLACIYHEQDIVTKLGHSSSILFLNKLEAVSYCCIFQCMVWNLLAFLFFNFFYSIICIQRLIPTLLIPMKDIFDNYWRSLPPPLISMRDIFIWTWVLLTYNHFLKFVHKLFKSYSKQNFMIWLHTITNMIFVLPVNLFLEKFITTNPHHGVSWFDHCCRKKLMEASIIQKRPLWLSPWGE